MSINISTDSFSNDNQNINNINVQNNNNNNQNQINGVQNNIYFQNNSDGHSISHLEGQASINNENQSNTNNTIVLNNIQSNNSQPGDSSSGYGNGIFSFISLNTIYGFIQTYLNFGINLKLISLNELIYKNEGNNYYMYIKYEFNSNSKIFFGNLECLVISGINKEDKEYYPKKEDFIKKHDFEFKGNYELDYPPKFQSEDIILEVRLNSEKFKFKNKMIKGKYKLTLKIKKDGFKINESEIGENIEIKYDNGDYYKGPMKDLYEEGIGEMKYNNGDEYKGNFKEGELDGKGEYKYKNGSIYNGRFKEGKFDGDGILFDRSDNKKYAVKYKDGDLLSKKLI